MINYVTTFWIIGSLYNVNTTINVWLNMQNNSLKNNIKKIRKHVIISEYISLKTKIDESCDYSSYELDPLYEVKHILYGSGYTFLETDPQSQEFP